MRAMVFITPGDHLCSFKMQIKKGEMLRIPGSGPGPGPGRVRVPRNGAKYFTHRGRVGGENVGEIKLFFRRLYKFFSGLRRLN